ncbi:MULTISPECIES: hypothetical protein [Paenibacillus]|uniref:hypothetical protein n=1 Tax=Paenibacillus TaxID=44249 RepID=UPI0015C32A80|nr:MULTISPECIES: hypothetical protein [Paenibacillus]
MHSKDEVRMWTSSDEGKLAFTRIFNQMKSTTLFWSSGVSDAFIVEIIKEMTAR